MAEQPVDERRAVAIKRIQERQGLRTHVVVYVVTNAMLVLIWFVTGLHFFWPIIPIAIWGIGLILHAYTVLTNAEEYTEEQVRKEMEKLPRDTIRS